MDDVVIGVGLGQTGPELPDPSKILRTIDRADDLGIDSVWVPDHPISERPALDTTALMAAIAARTDSIKMGPSVLTLPARNPVVVAGSYATLDYLTGGTGRVIMGVGLGAEPRLCETLGIEPEGRAPRLREAIEVLRLLWTEDDVDYHGSYYELDGVSVTPKPAGGPLDIWIGGNSDAALKRVAAYGDGWFPALLPPAAFGAKLDRLMDYCEEAGRHVDRDEAGVIIPTYVSEDPERVRAVREPYLANRNLDRSQGALEQCTAFGTAAECIETVQRYVDAGCTKFVLSPVGPEAERVEQLERYSEAVIPTFGAAG